MFYVIGVVLALLGLWLLLTGSVLLGILLIVVGALVAPGGRYYVSRRGP